MTVEEWARRIRQETEANYHYAMGNALLVENDPAAAAAAFRRAMGLSPDYRGTRRNLIAALEALGDSDEAIALRRDGDEAAAALGWHDIGQVLEIHGRVADALDAYERALALDADCVDAARRAGEILLVQKRPDEAASALRRVVDIAPEDASVDRWARELARLAGFAMEKRDFDAAARGFRLAVSIQPTLAFGWRQLGHALNEIGQAAEGARHLRKAEALAPDDAAILVLACGGALRSGRPEEALVLARRATILAPNDPVAGMQTARALLATGDPEGAAATAARTLTTHPGFAGARAALARALRALGREDEATTEMRAAVQVNPHPEWIDELRAWTGEADRLSREPRSR